MSVSVDLRSPRRPCHRAAGAAARASLGLAPENKVARALMASAPAGTGSDAALPVFERQQAALKKVSAKGVLNKTRRANWPTSAKQANASTAARIAPDA